MNAYDRLLAQIQSAIAASRPNVPPHPSRHRDKARRPSQAEPAVHKAKATKHRKARRATKRRKAHR